ncbi:MAG TPA: adenylate/guanylate cyclase domain-containing protein [Acidimicrobiales bacterium]|nr:adenylate/guanylate cyclase domain-containing protein [Acidimicrobiales bacterium]
MRADSSRPDRWHVTFRTFASLSLANAGGAVLVFVYLTMLAPEYGDEPRTTNLGLSVATFVAYWLVILPIGYVAGRRLLWSATCWLDEHRPPTEEERRDTLRTPWRFLGLVLAFWLGAPVVFGSLNLVVLGNPWSIVVRNTIGTLLGALTTGALTFLLVERALRPVVALALHGTPPPGTRALGIRPRLIVSWALGSGIPFVAIAMTVSHTHGADVRLAVAFLACAGMVGGGLVLFAAADSVSTPLEHLRGAVRQVEQGDLEVEVTVDDGGEVGRLQAGFNAMVTGLRERQQLRDLFGRYVGVDVARQALLQTGLGGEQRVASALFVDLVGSTGLAERRPPSEVVRTLNAMFDAVVDVVGKEGGWVNKFEGDGALCVFGAPVAQADHAARALRAARQLRRCLVALRVEHPSLDAGIGVSSGTVVAGNVGAEARYEYTVIGDPVNEAARLTELAKQRPGRVLAAEGAVHLAGEEAQCWVSVGSFELRGRAVPTRAYEPRSS